MNRRNFLKATGVIFAAVALPAAATPAPVRPPKMEIGRVHGVKFIHTERIERYTFAGALGWFEPAPWMVHYHTTGDPEFEFATLFLEYPTAEQLDKNREIAVLAFERAWKRKHG